MRTPKATATYVWVLRITKKWMKWEKLRSPWPSSLSTVWTIHDSQQLQPRGMISQKSAEEALCHVHT